MGKIIMYECDLCGIVTKQKNNVFVLQGTIYNGEDEILFESENNKTLMICSTCIKQNLNDQIECQTMPIIKEETQEEIRELIEIKTTKFKEKINELKEQQNIKSSHSFLDQIKDNIKDEELSIPDDEFHLKEEILHTMNEEIDEIIESDNSILNNDENLEIDKSENLELEENNINDNTHNFDLFDIVKITENEFDNIAKHFGFENIEEFYSETNIKTLNNVFVGLNSGIKLNDTITIDSIMQTHSMSIENIFIVNNDKIYIKKASVFVNNNEGYISKEILNQLYGNS